jgi:membrane protein YdbS with pleckstrin-like domain
MKKFELRMAIVMLLLTTILIMILYFTISHELENIFIMVIVAALGYGISNLYLDSYLYRYGVYNYDKGLDACKETNKTDDYDKIF